MPLVGSGNLGLSQFACRIGGAGRCLTGLSQLA
jgi:hypothetical protein